ncbi:hypothetical protein [Rubritalea tangerina]|uniref:hypothetical protein n=1 Tax=Rubritalea tangerina TaxID=430798 RepID=UPI00361BE551
MHTTYSSKPQNTRDGGICDSLANSIYSGRLAMKGIGNKKEAIANLKKSASALFTT